MHNNLCKISKSHLAFFAKSNRAPHSEDEGIMAPTSNLSSVYCITNNYSYGLWYYSPFCTGSVPFSSGIDCISPSFLFSGTFLNNYPGNTLQYLCSTSCSGPQYSWVTPSKWGTATSGRSSSPYKTSWEKKKRFQMFLIKYKIIWCCHIVSHLGGHNYYFIIFMLVGRA